jgi:hypothetical protein
MVELPARKNILTGTAMAYMNSKNCTVTPTNIMGRGVTRRN